MGSRPHAAAGGFRCPASKPRQTMPTISLRRTAPPDRKPLEHALLRRSVGEQEAHRHRCVHCHRTPLTGEVVHIYAAAAGERLVCELCRPLRREAPGPLAARCTRPSTSARCASRAAPPDAPARRAPARSTRLPRRCGPRHAARQHRPAAGGGVRLPVGHRQPPGVHRPLPDGLAAHARGVRRPRRRRALPPGRPLRPLRLLRPQPRRARAAVPDRRASAAAGSTTASRRSTSGRWSRTPAGRGSSTSTRPSRRCRPTASSRRVEPPARLVPPQRRQGPAAPAQHPRGEPGSRRAGDRSAD